MQELGTNQLKSETSAHSYAYFSIGNQSYIVDLLRSYTKFLQHSLKRGAGGPQNVLRLQSIHRLVKSQKLSEQAPPAQGNK